MWMSSAVPYISSFCHQQTHTVIFTFFWCTMHYTFQRLFYVVHSMPPFFLINHSHKQVLLIEWVIFFWCSKIFFALFNFLKMLRFTTLINLVNINVDLDDVDDGQRFKFKRWHTQHFFNADLTLSNFAKSYHPKNNVETTLKGFLSIDECC